MSKTKIQQVIRWVSLWVIMSFLVAACNSNDGPIVAVTPIALESAELNPESTPIISIDPSPLDAVSTVAAYPANEASITVIDTSYPEPVVDTGYPEPVDETRDDLIVEAPTVAPGSGLIAPEDEPTLEPIPVMQRIPRGVALEQALDEDRAWVVEPSGQMTFADEPVTLKFDEFFVDYDPWSDQAPILSDKLIALDGRQVIIEGFTTVQNYRARKEVENDYQMR